MQSKPLLLRLTGFRALAAYLVLLCHGLDIAFADGGVSYIQRYTACFAYLGMSLFFVLSGFVITYGYHERFKQGVWKEEVYRFAIARFARLYPLYLFVMVVVESRSARHLYRKAEGIVQVSFVTLTQSWWNFQSIVFPPAWSISTEAFFYVIFAALMLCISRHKALSSSRWLMSGAVLTYALFMVGLYLCLINKPEITAFLASVREHESNPDVWKWLQYFSPYVRIGEFFLGAFAAYLYMRPAKENHTPHSPILILGAVIAIIAVMLCHVLYYEEESFLYLLSMNFGYAPFIAYILYATSRYPGALTRLFSHRFALIAGDMSYSVYLLQFFILKKVKHFFPSGKPADLATADIVQSLLTLIPVFILISVVSHISYRFIEVPSRRFIRKKLGG